MRKNNLHCRWRRKSAGLPKSPVSKIDVAIAPSSPKRMYPLIQTADQGSIWRSDDAGENWNVGSWQRALMPPKTTGSGQ